MQAQLSLFRNNLPKKTRCCDEFSVDNRIRHIGEAIKKRYIQANDFNSLKWLVFDLDRPTCVEEIRHDKLAPEPTVLVSNPKNRHAHAFYLLKTPVHQNANSSQKAIQFASAVDCALAVKLDADLGYAGLLAKNALHKKWELQHTTMPIYELGDLAEWIDLATLKKYTKKPLEYGLGRNCILFDDVRKWAYKAIRQGFPDHERWEKAVKQRVEMLNFKFDNPLPHSEINHIAKSVAKWTIKRFSSGGFSDWQAKNGKRSGVVRAKKNEDKKIQARLMFSTGLPKKEIADNLNVHINTLYRWLSS